MLSQWLDMCPSHAVPVISDLQGHAEEVHDTVPSHLV